MKNLFIVALSTLTLATACKKSDDSTPTVTTMQVSGALNVASEIPAPKTPTNGSGTVTGTFDPTSMMLNYTITYANMTAAPSSGHFHFGAPGHARSGNVTYAFPAASIPTTTSGTITGSTTLSSMQADSLLAGHIYANLHTNPNNPAGEIRADLVVKK